MTARVQLGMGRGVHAQMPTRYILHRPKALIKSKIFLVFHVEIR